MAEYKLLDKTITYDVDKVREMAAAMNEFRELSAQVKYLGELLNDNKDVLPYIHNTRAGESIALVDMENSHLENLVKLIQAREGVLSRELMAECSKRSIAVVGGSTKLTQRLLDASSDDEDDIVDLNDIDF